MLKKNNLCFLIYVFLEFYLWSTHFFQLSVLFCLGNKRNIEMYISSSDLHPIFL